MYFEDDMRWMELGFVPNHLRAATLRPYSAARDDPVGPLEAAPQRAGRSEPEDQG
jgi:hypothetical protein